jgi:RimJ/RimL family protein N-acetyltransferase
METRENTFLIETDRIILRTWRASDRAAFAAMSADPRVMAHLSPLDGEEAITAYLERNALHQARHGFSRWVMEERDTGAFAGVAGLRVVDFTAHFTPAVEIAWRMPVAFWGKGLATEAARACIEYGFNALKLREIVAITTSGNLRSRALMLRLGMTQNPTDDFIHPGLAADHPFQPCQLYRIANPHHDQGKIT